LIAGLAILVLDANAQRKTYLGFEFGPKYSTSRTTVAASSIEAGTVDDGIVGGVTLGQEIGEKLLLETGFYAYRYGTSVTMNSTRTTTRAFGASQIPFHVKAPFSLFGSRLRLTPALGYSVVFKNNYGYRYESEGMLVGRYPDGEYAAVDSPTNLKKVFVLLDAGVSLEWEFKSTVILYLSGNYFGGPQRVTESDMVFKVGSEPLQAGQFYSNGSYFSKTLGVKFPISPIWQYKR